MVNDPWSISVAPAISDQSPPPLAVFAATSNWPASSEVSVRPLLAAEVVSLTNTWNVDVDVADPALPAAMAAAENTNAAANAMRFIAPPLPYVVRVPSSVVVIRERHLRSGHSRPPSVRLRRRSARRFVLRRSPTPARGRPCAGCHRALVGRGR